MLQRKFVIGLIVLFTLLGLRHFSNANTLPYINGIIWSPDGLSYAMSDNRGVISIWDGVLSELTTSFEGHSDYINQLAWSIDGKLLASASADHTARVWDVKTGLLVVTLEHDLSVNSVAWDSNGYLLTGTSLVDYEDRPAAIRIWDIVTGELLKTKPFPADRITFTSDYSHILVSPDTGLYLSVLSYPSLIEIGQLPMVSNLMIDPESGQRDYITSNAFELSATQIAVGYVNGFIRVWDIQTNMLIATYVASDSIFNPFDEFYSTKVKSLAFYDGLLLAVAADGTTRQWDTETGALIAEAQLPSVVTATWSPDGTRLAYVPFSDDGTRAETGVTIVSPFEQP